MCKVNMLGYQIEVDYGAHVKERLRSRFDDVDIAFLEYRIEAVFSDEAVADHLMNEVKILYPHLTLTAVDTKERVDIQVVINGNTASIFPA